MNSKSIQQTYAVESRAYGLPQAVQMGARQSWYIVETMVSIPVMIVRGIIPAELARPVGPVGIARIVGELFREPDAQLGFLLFGTTMGHFNSTMEDPVYLDLVTRGQSPL